jgi:hypothetical protein
MKPHLVGEDLESWAPLLAWLDEPTRRAAPPPAARPNLLA